MTPSPPPPRVAEGPKFEELEPPLRKQTLAILKSPKLNFLRSTPVQAAVIGLLGKNKDVSVEACTGSGKTLAFVLPMIEILWKSNKESKFKKHSIGAVIVSPTRELARQIRDVAEPFLESLAETTDDDEESKEYAKFSPDVKPMLLVGGGTQTVADDLKRFSERGSLCLIGTPGRMLDVLTKARDLDAKRCELLVLDEADRVLGMGFAKTLNSIIGMLPKQRRTGLFSATQTEELEELARAGLRNPVRVTVRDSNAAAAAAAAAAAVNKSEGGKDSDGDKKKGAAVGSKLPTQLELSYRICESVDAKIFRLAEFLKAKKGKKIIVYFLTCACVDYYQKALETLLDIGSGNSKNSSSSGKKKKPTKNGSNNSRIELFALHGKMKQAQREQTLENFAENKECDDGNGVESSILLTTDVAARGLDIPGVDWIVQFDMPQDPSAFTHRVGRTARMGAKGSALALLTKEESSYVAFLKIRGVYLRRDGNCRFADGDNGDGEEEEEEEEDNLDAVIEEDANGARKVYETLRELSKRDREAMEKGVRAFVSYVRGYKEHHCRFIFRLKELHLAKLANAMGLLRLPKMKEIRKAAKNTLEGFEECVDVDIDAIPYLDQQREKQRKIQLQKERLEKEARGEHEHEEAARNKESRGNNEKKKEKKPEKKLTAHKRRQIETREELDELEDDYRALKKWKKGKISEEEFEFELGWDENPNQAGKVRIKETDKDEKNTFSAHHSSSGKQQQRKEDLYRNGDDLWRKEKKKPKHVKQSKGGQGKKYQKARERAAAKAKQ